MAAPEYQVSVIVKRCSGDKFFLEGSFLLEGREKARKWTFYRTYADFRKLDRILRRMAGDDASEMDALPPEPFVIGDGSGGEPFSAYLKMLLGIPEAFEVPEIYEFCETPPDVLTAAFPGKVPIDVDVVGGEPRFSGKASAVPTLDPVMLAEQAGRAVKGGKEAWKEAEVAKAAGKRAAEIKGELDEVLTPVLGEVAKKVDSRKTGSAFGSVLGNLRSGKGLFGEEATQKFTEQVSSAVGSVLEEIEGEVEYSADDKWDVEVQGPAGAPLEVTVRPTQKARLLLKAWLAENEVDADAAGDYVLMCKGAEVDPEGEIGQSGARPGASLTVAKRG